MLADILYNYKRIELNGDITQIRAPWLRYSHYCVIALPTFVICFIYLPQDFYAEFNMYPEQIDRVSIVQFSKYNYSASDNLLANCTLSKKIGLYS